MVASLSEGLLLSEKIGFDPSILVEVVSQGPLVHLCFGKMPFNGQFLFSAAFPLKHQQKGLVACSGISRIRFPTYTKCSCSEQTIQRWLNLTALVTRTSSSIQIMGGGNHGTHVLWVRIFKQDLAANPSGFLLLLFSALFTIGLVSRWMMAAPDDDIIITVSEVGNLDAMESSFIQGVFDLGGRGTLALFHEMADSLSTGRRSCQAIPNYDHSGIGWVLMEEEEGELVEQQDRSTLASSAVHAEFLACLGVMIWCFDRHFRHITVATDCSSMVDETPEEKEFFFF
ncbi:hypothetical protein RHGRI_024968 [Rhododendron griersonianum]|uniref:RNase H type-1 domain-containing protein n=1 Tax=Rhododendron griersonianum TaxID=479676 RepID=A0AAV6JDN6_9ERIC|nr:hypothetical protein RHGRI_024968 [Rhododendron griersonianum]